MANADIPVYISARLGSGETVLWKHFTDAGSTMKDLYGDKRLPLWITVPALALILLPLWRDYQSSPETFLQSITPNVGFAVLVFSLVWLIKFTGLGERLLKAAQPHALYNGLVITNRNVIVFNTLSQAKFFPRETIKAFQEDCENGARALAFQTAASKKKIIITGTADFAAAVRSFNQNTQGLTQ